jgi:toxin ParE1/3/4
MAHNSMPIVQRTALAEEDLIDIWAYIAQDNEQAADTMLDDIEKRCQLLAEFPHMGQTRPDIAPDFHHSPVGRYLILYRPIPNGIELVRVVFAGRDMSKLL